MLCSICLALVPVSVSTDPFPPTAESMVFLAIGDWGGSGDSAPTTPTERDNAQGMGNVAEAVGGVRFVLAQGDNFYFHGINGNDQCPRFKSGFEDEFNHPALQVNFYAIAGNHDHYGNVTAQVAYTHDSKRWVFPSLWYSFSESFNTSAGKIVTTEFVQLDTVTLAGMSDDDDLGVLHPHPMQAYNAEQMRFLEQTLAASTADYLWVGGHYPMYSQCQHGPTDEIISQVLPLMQKYKASGMIAGHDHCMAHYVEDNMAFVLTGAGKQCCYHPANINNGKNPGQPAFRMDRDRFLGTAGFTSFTVTEAGTTIKYHDQHGKELYTSEAVKPRSTSGTPSPTPPPRNWECYSDRKSNLGGDSDAYWFASQDLCKAHCDSIPGCVAINWHKPYQHCHIKVGSFPESVFKTSLQRDTNWNSCWAGASQIGYTQTVV